MLGISRVDRRYLLAEALYWNRCNLQALNIEQCLLKQRLQNGGDVAATLRGWSVAQTEWELESPHPVFSSPLVLKFTADRLLITCSFAIGLEGIDRAGGQR